MANQDTVAVIRDLLDKNATERERLSREENALRLTVEILSRNEGRWPRQKAKSRRVRGPRIPPLPDDIDISGAATIAECLTVIGRSVPEEELNTTQVARLLIKTGKSRAKLDSLRSTVRARLNAHPDFVWVRRGWYRYAPGEHDCDGSDDCAVLGILRLR